MTLLHAALLALAFLTALPLGRRHAPVTVALACVGISALVAWWLGESTEGWGRWATGAAVALVPPVAVVGCAWWGRRAVG